MKNYFKLISIIILLLLITFSYRKIFSKENFSVKKKKIISFSLWGNSECYNYGALENALLAKKIYPGWIVRLYVSNDTIPSVIQKLEQLDNVEIVHKKSIKNGEFWRFEPLFENDVEIMLSRDSDSLLNIREKKAVDEWIKSDKSFHIMRDHNHHKSRILAGMFGAKVSKLNLNYNEYKNYLSKIKNKKGQDQIWLGNVIYPIVKNDCMIHASKNFFDDEKILDFPESNYTDFVGSIVCEGDRYHEIKKKYNYNFDELKRQNNFNVS